MVGKHRVWGWGFVTLAQLSCASIIADDDGPLPEALACESQVEDAALGFTFDPAVRHCLGLDLPDADWSVLKASHRFGNGEPERHVVQLLTRDCTTPIPQRYPWSKAKLDFGDLQLSRVGIRKKGFLGSVTGHGMLKPSLRIKIDKYVADQELVGQERLVFNNSSQDPTRIRTCLAFDVFARAGYPAPGCNIAGIMVNEQPMGPFAHLEDFKKAFLKREFGRADGSLYEGTIVDFLPSFHNQTSANLGRWEAKTGETDPTGAPLLALQDALLAPDEELLNRLEPHLNLERFIRFWALEFLIEHRDGYAGNRNNFFIYFDPNDAGRAVFLPWGVDDVLGNVPQEVLQPAKDYTFAELPRRLSRLSKVRNLFEQEVERLLDEVWERSWLSDRLELYAEHVVSLQIDPEYDAERTRLLAWLEQRPDDVRSLLKGGLARGEAQSPNCFAIGLEDGLTLIQDLNQAVGTYNTSW